MKCPSPTVHGTQWARYRWRCTCPRVDSKWRAPYIKSTGKRWEFEDLHREVLRLTRYGFSANEIAIRLGVTQRTVTRHRTGTRERVAVLRET